MYESYGAAINELSKYHDDVAARVGVLREALGAAMEQGLPPPDKSLPHILMWSLPDHEGKRRAYVVATVLPDHRLRVVCSHAKTISSSSLELAKVGNAMTIFAQQTKAHLDRIKEELAQLAADSPSSIGQG